MVLPLEGLKVVAIEQAVAAPTPRPGLRMPERQSPRSNGPRVILPGV